MPIVPLAKSLFLSDDYAVYAVNKVDLFGLFNAIRPAGGYPHVRSHFCVYAQLVNGLGKVPFQIDIRLADADEVVHTTGGLILNFPDRLTVVHMAVAISDCHFPEPGLYLVEFFCDNEFVSDAPLHLLESN